MDHKEETVSIIVPVYNVEKYIGRCIKSLLAQDYNNIEVILVDDGSPDKSPAIIDSMAAQDSRIRVVHQDNHGVSTARNVGISLATGKYLMFVDGDDWVDPDYVSYFVKLIESNNSSVGMNKNNYSTQKLKTSDETYIVSAETAIEWIYSGDIFVAVWNKIYLREFLNSFKLTFNPDIWYGEGMLFNIMCLQYVDSVAIGEKSVYHQTYNPDSAMRKFNLESNLCGIKSLDIQKELWKKVTPGIKKQWQYHRYRFNRTIVSGLLSSGMTDEYPVLYKECISNIRKELWMPLSMEKKMKTKLGWIVYAMSPSLISVRSRIIRKKLVDKFGGGI